MKIRASGGSPELASLYRVVTIGYVIGAGALFLIPTILAVTFGGLGSATSSPGQSTPSPFLFVLLVPIVLGMQSLIFGGIVILGLAIYRRWRPIAVVSTE